MNKRIFLILAIVISFFVVLGVGASAGGAVAYLALKDKPQAALAFAQAQPDRSEAILIARVEPESPADQAGLVRGDLLIEVNQQSVKDFSAVLEILEDLKAGDVVDLIVLHGDEQRTLQATLVDRAGRPYLGIETCNCSHPGEVIFQTPGLSGAILTQVAPGSPAEQAGLQAGDRILSIDGQELGTGKDLAEVITSHQPGDVLRLQVERSGEVGRAVQVTLGEHPEQAGKAYLGVNFVPRLHFPRFDGEWKPFEQLIPRLEQLPFEFDLNDLPEGIEQVILVREVLPDSPAEQAGLQRRDIISAIDGQAVKDMSSFLQAIQEHQPGDPIDLTVHRLNEDQPRTIEVTLGEDPGQAGKAYLGIRVISFSKVLDVDSDTEPDGQIYPGPVFRTFPRFRIPGQDV